MNGVRYGVFCALLIEFMENKMTFFFFLLLPILLHMEILYILIEHIGTLSLSLRTHLYY